MKKVHPELDMPDKNDWVEQAIPPVDAAAQANAFIVMRPEFYASHANCSKLEAWLEEKGALPTCRNFLIGYDVLRDELEPRPVEESPVPELVDDIRGVTYLPSTARARYSAEATEENKNQHAENLRVLRDGFPIGKKPEPWLREAVEQSRIEERKAQAPPISLAAARAVVGYLHPGWRPYTPQFANEVARLANNPQAYETEAAKLPTRN